ncbi:PKD domain-containing protein [bacterium]|nr:PKD domain-containing protein [bacterium]
MKKFLAGAMLVLSTAIVLTSLVFAQGSPNEPPVAGINAVIIIIHGRDNDDKKSVDGTPSYDLDGEVVHYRWDLDGDGSFETDTGDVPRAEVGFTEPGQYWVGLQVTDDDGATDTRYAWVTLE